MVLEINSEKTKNSCAGISQVLVIILSPFLHWAAHLSCSGWTGVVLTFYNLSFLWQCSNAIISPFSDDALSLSLSPLLWISPPWLSDLLASFAACSRLILSNTHTNTYASYTHAHMIQSFRHSFSLVFCCFFPLFTFTSFFLDLVFLYWQWNFNTQKKSETAAKKKMIK